eukprot:CAMPEP_0194162536 /NCGR_PEP_ID=MMETSP0152-20130528/79549_1 /TAXON_ID=1049557 /ORGANISM="Thalassiothrix antarctica, Strain L6-D1" /LENGTH=209 /DNA_ID=CAMNT_0038872441 /DNA_START=36 /DNA_END=669 /DNA_ORIENTATION=+
MSTEEKKEEEDLLTLLSSLILENSLATSDEEAEAIASCIIVDTKEIEDKFEEYSLLFQEYFNLSEDETKRIILGSNFCYKITIRGNNNGEINESYKGDNNEVSNKEKDNATHIYLDDDDDDDDDDEMIGEGECELCEREIKLTRHHLIPRSTWKRMFPKISNAIQAFSKNDTECAIRIQKIMDYYISNKTYDNTTKVLAVIRLLPHDDP